jgi:hypothetical protein
MPRAAIFIRLLVYPDDYIVIILLVVTPTFTIVTAGAVGYIIYVDPPRVPRIHLRHVYAR